MEELIKLLKTESESLDQQIAISRQRWESFLNTFSSFVSKYHVNGKPILPPVMTPERRREMQMYRKQACITEVRLKSRSRERDFLKRIQNAMDELQSERRGDDSSSASEPMESQQFTPCLQDKPATTDESAAPKSPPPPKEIVSTPPLLSQSPKPQRPITPGSPRQKHKVITPASSKVLPFAPIPSPSSSTPVGFDVHASDSDSGENRRLIIVKGARIHRRRKDSGGKSSTDSQASANTEPALRRAASGDIAIGTAQAPIQRVMRHKRGGSGDLVTINITQDPINKKLSQSQDVSLRRTKSSELPVDSERLSPHRVHSDSPNLSSLPVDMTSDAIDLKQQLSPHSTASTPGKERLIMFSRGESLRRPTQNGNQESTGPPQPIKAIHKIANVSDVKTTMSSPSFDYVVPSGPYFPDTTASGKVKEVSEEQADQGKEITPEKANDSGIASQPEKESDTADDRPVSPPFASSDPMAVTVLRRSLTSETSRKSTPLLDAVALVDESAVVSVPQPLVVTTSKHLPSPVTADSLECYDSDVIASPGGYKQLPEKLSSQHDSLTQQWLLQKISELSSQKDGSIAGWLQNAPDSVKQKLSDIIPSVAQTSAVKADKSTEVRHTDVSHSIDDTLRSTSPMPDEELMPTEMLTELPDKSAPLLIRSNSYTLDRPSAALLTVQKPVKKSSPLSSSPPKSFSEFVPEKSESLPMVTSSRADKKKMCNETAATVDEQSVTPPKSVPESPESAPEQSSPPSAKERSRAVSSKSYVVEKPSPALLDSLHESEKSTVEQAYTDSQKGKSPHRTQKSQSNSGSHSKTSESRPDSRSSTGQRRSAQRKLDYEKPTLSQTSQYESAEGGKTAHLHRYLQQLGQAEKPVNPTLDVKEAWSAHLVEKPASSTPAVKEAWSVQQTASVVKPLQKHVESNRQATSAVVNRAGEAKENSPSGQGMNLSLREALLLAEQKKAVQKVPVHNDKEDSTLKQVRKELTLLKSKYANKLSPRDTNERPTSAEPPLTKQIIEDMDRPSTAFAHMSPYTHKYYRYQQTHSGKQTTKSGSRLHSTPVDKRISKGKENPFYPYAFENFYAQGDSGHVKSYAEKEATPISSAYSIASDLDKSAMDDYSSYGGIVSLSHRPSTAVSPAHRPDAHNLSTSQRPHTSPGQSASMSRRRLREAPSAKLAALIKGHLCRKLISCSKVQSIVRTVKDCRNLLPERFVHSSPQKVSTLSLHDTHFQERLRVQMQSALLDIHEIFFELSNQKRISLIEQSELMDAQSKSKTARQHVSVKKSTVRREKSTKRESQQSRVQSKPVQANAAHRIPLYLQTVDSPTTNKRISAATQKVLERKKVQRASSDPTRSLNVKMKRSVLAPTFAAASPKKASTVTDRVTQFQQTAK